MIARIVRYAVTITASIASIVYLRYRFRRWRLGLLRRIRRESQIVRTAYGPVEYKLTGAGPVVLVVHGGPGGYDAWVAYQHLVEQGFAVLSPSRPGYLRTTLPGREGFVAQADLLLALVETLGIPQVAVIGFSAGGPVALQLALRGGPRVRALILESAITHRFVAADPTEDMLIASGWIPHLLQRVMFWIAHRVVNRLPRVVLPFALGAVMNAPASAVQSCAEQIGQDPTQLRKFKVLFDNSVPLNLRQKGYDNDLWQFAHMPEYLLGEVRVPTLIVHSTRDASVPFEHAQYAASRIPGAELYDVEGCGHLVQFGTSGAAVQARMGEFLRTHLRPV